MAYNIKTLMYDIGTEFIGTGKHASVETVVDVLMTYDSKNSLVKLRYVTSHKFLGQTIMNRDVLSSTIAKGIQNLESTRKAAVAKTIQK